MNAKFPILIVAGLFFASVSKAQYAGSCDDHRMGTARGRYDERRDWRAEEYERYRPYRRDYRGDRREYYRDRNDYRGDRKVYYRDRNDYRAAPYGSPRREAYGY